MPSKETVLLLSSCNCVALVLQEQDVEKKVGPQEDGRSVFSNFLFQNSVCVWNACLVRSVSSLEYRGWIMPHTLLLHGTPFSLEILRSAWARRVLRPPKGYVICKLGEVCGPVDMRCVPQTQFAPLPEALCKVVAELNDIREPANPLSIRKTLEEHFPGMQIPSEDFLHKNLGTLIRQRKLYHTGKGYFVVSSSMYQGQQPPERQMLMTNEEAIVHLHGEDSSASFLMYAGKNVSHQATQIPSDGKSGDEDILTSRIAQQLELNAIPKNAKESMLAKLLRRMQLLTENSSTRSFSAQFPPPEWFGTTTIFCHSVSTQTQGKKEQSGSKDQNKRLCSQSDEWKPSHRHSYGTSYGRQRRTRNHRSSSENSKIQRTNGHSTSSKSNTESTDGKVNPKEFETKPFDRPDWKHAFNYLPNRKSAFQSSFKDSRSSRKSSVQSPSNYFSNSETYSGRESSLLFSKTDSTGVKSPSNYFSNSETYSGRESSLLLSKTDLAGVKSPSNYFSNSETREGTSGGEPDSRDDQPNLKPRLSHCKGPLKCMENTPAMNGKLTAPGIVKEVIKSDLASVEKGDQQPSNEPTSPLLPNLRSKNIVIDNSVSVQVDVKSNATTVVTEETTVTKGKAKVVTVTSVTTSLSQLDAPKSDKVSVNDLNRSSLPTV